MSFPYYTAEPEKKSGQTLESLPKWPRGSKLAAENYKPAPGLVDAVNVALILGQPLLLTGEPGTGKTQLAYSVAWQFGKKETGNDKPLSFETKSSSKASDLFY